MGKKIIAVTTKEIANDNRVINYTNALAENGHQVYLICPQTSRHASYAFTPAYIALIADSFPVSFLFNLLKTLEFTLKSVRAARHFECEIIHANDLQGLAVAVAMKWLVHSDARIVYDAHEYETEANGIVGFRQKVYKYLERKWIKKVSHVITVSDTIAEEYVNLYEIKKPTVLLNVPNKTREDNFHYDLFREKLGIRKDQRIFLYQGYLMPGRGVEILLSTFAAMNTDQYVIVFMGKGDLKSSIEQHTQHGNIFFHDFVDPREYLNFTSSADVGISFIEDISLSDRYCLPNKLFEYILCGLPVICSNLPEMKRLVETHNVGIVAKNNSKDGFMNAIEEMIKKGVGGFKSNTKKASETYSWAKQEAKLVDLYQNI